MNMNVAVIGAGGAGLCCARHLSRYPDLFRFSVFDKAGQVGGTWVYSERTELDEHGLPVHSSMYQGLKTNLPKEVMQFPDFPFRKDLPSYVGHADMLEYLQQYTAHYNLHQYIHFNTLIEKVESVPVESQAVSETADPERGPACLDSVKWKIQSKNLKTGALTEALYDAVLVCNGHYFKPNVPDIPGVDQFPGQVLHSHYYRSSQAFTGRRVLVVGTAGSGTDIMIAVAASAQSVYLVYHTRPMEYRLPPNGEQFPAVAQVDSDGVVHFENGESRLVDDIILCTGYQYQFPFLSNESGIRVELGKRVAPLFKHTFNAVHPSMAFIGINFVVLPFPLFDIQTKLVISVLTGKTRLPSMQDMIQDCEEEYLSRLDQGIPHHHAHRLGNQFDFFRDIARLAGLEPLDPSYEAVYFHNQIQRKKDALNYKKYNYVIQKGGNEKAITISRHLIPGQTLV